MTLIACSVLLKGAYTRADRSIPAQYAGPEAEDRLGALRHVALEPGATANQVLIAWMRQRDPPVLPIVAASRREQLLEDMAALDLRLTDEQVRKLDTADNPDIKQAWLPVADRSVAQPSGCPLGTRAETGAAGSGVYTRVFVCSAVKPQA